MNDTKYAYAVANVRAKEPELLTKSFMEQLADANTFDDARRALLDKGFSGFEKTSDASVALGDYMVKTWDFLQDILPEKDALDFLVVKNDFHNLKAVVKGMVSGNEGTKYCIKPCILDVDFLNEKINEKDFEALPRWMAKTAENAYELLTSTMDGQMFDMFVDVASMRTMIDFSKRAESQLAEDIAELFAALTDIKIAVRIAGTTKGISFVDNAFCKCAALDIDDLKKAVLKGKEEVASYIQTTEYAGLYESILKSSADLERECDNIFMERLDEAKSISFGPEPLICYYYARETEWKLLRIIVSGKYTDLPKESIAERMRELYV